MNLRAADSPGPGLRDAHAEPRGSRGAGSERWLDRSWDALLVRIAGMLVGPQASDALRELERVQWLPADALAARDERRLAPLLRNAAEHVPFYRKTYRRLDLDPGDLRTIADLARLPIVNKMTHRDCPPDHFMAENVPIHRRLADRTSGSTGEPLRFFVDRHAMPGILASHLMFDAWFGIRPFQRNVRIRRPGAALSHAPEGMPLGVRLHHGLVRRLKAMYEGRTQRRISVWEAGGEQAVSVYRQLEAFHPDYIHGYASTLATLADELERRGLRLSHPVRAVINFAETLTPPRKLLIERYFQAPIINRYGMREIGSYFAQSCPVSPDRFHVNTERVVWETLRADGTPAAPGEMGRVVVTALDNYVMPFIRYDTGDLAVVGGEPCPCGRGLPLVGPIDGRSSECLRTPSGKVIGPVALAAYLILDPGHVDVVRQYQLVQEAPERVRLLIVPAPELMETQRERLRSGLLQRLNEFLGPEMAATVELVADIPTERSGKRLVINQVSTQCPGEGETVA